MNSRGRSRWLLLLGPVVGCVMLVAGWFAADLLYVATDNEVDHTVPSDVIIIFGCPSYEGNVISTTFSACVQARAHHAADLYRRGMAPHIIPTGGLTGPPPTEAAAMASILRSDGVPGDAITIEDRARDTVQNVQFSREIMRGHGWHTAILVSEPNHIKRAAYIARDAGLAFTTSPATDSPGWRNPDRYKNVLRDARNLMTYQFNRLATGPP